MRAVDIYVTLQLFSVLYTTTGHYLNLKLLT